MKKSKKEIIINSIIGVLFALAVLLVIVLMIGKVSGRIVFIGNRSVVWILTDSMEDKIPAQSYILIKKADPSQIEVGDIITFYSDDPRLGGNLNTHEVIEVVGNHEEFITRGANALASTDSYTAKADKVKGVYLRNLPVLTVIGRFMLNRFGFIVVVGLVLVLTFVLYLPDFKKAYRESKKKDDGEADETQS